MDIPRCTIIGETKRERVTKLFNFLLQKRFYKENVGFTSGWLGRGLCGGGAVVFLKVVIREN